MQHRKPGSAGHLSFRTFQLAAKAWEKPDRFQIHEGLKHKEMTRKLLWIEYPLPNRRLAVEKTPVRGGL